MTRPNSDDPFLPSPPETFGPFRVLHQIGAGVLGPVYRTHQIDRNRLVAVKAFKLDLTPEQLELLAGELTQLVDAAVGHPSIVRPLAAGVETGRVYLAQEYVAGESLDVPLRLYQTLPVEDVLRLVTELAAALDTAAVSGLHHGRLHLRDVMLAGGDVKLTGLGIARAVEAIGLQVPVRRAYAAPERLAGCDWGRAADCFALGALAYELLLGRRLVGSADTAADQIRATAGDADAPLIETLAAAVAPDPADRFSTAADFAAALERAASRAGRTAQPAALADDHPDLSVDPGELAGDAVERTEPDLAERTFGRAAPEPVPELATPAFDCDHDQEPAGIWSAAGLTVEPTEPANESLPGGALAVAAHLAAPPGHPESDPDEIGWRHVPERVAPSHRGRTAFGIAAAVVVALAVGDQLLNRSTLQVEAPPSGPVVAEGQRDWTEREVPADAAPAARPVPVEPPRAAPRQPSRPVSTPASTSGRMLVRSTPAGAVVVVNGERRGLTPLAVRGLPLGSHTVRVNRPGYPPAERRVRLTGARPAQSLTIALERVRARPAVALTRVGSLGVRSRPAGAAVYLDGSLIGTTPLVIAGVNAGAHVVRIEKAGYRRWSTSVSVVPGDRVPVTASLDWERSR